MLHSYLDTSRNFEFVCMDLWRDTVTCSFSKNPVGFFHSKESLVAEYVNKVCKSFLGNAREHLLTYKIHIFALTSSIGATDSMCPQEVGTNGNRSCLLYALDDTKHLQLILDSKSVSALDLDGACTHGHDFTYTDHRLFVKFILRSLVKQIR